MPDTWTVLAIVLAAIGLLWLGITAIRNWYFDNISPVTAYLGPMHRRTKVGGHVQWEFVVSNRSSRGVSILLGNAWLGDAKFATSLGPAEVIRLPHGTPVGQFFDIGPHDRERFRARRQLLAPTIGALAMVVSDARIPTREFETLWFEIGSDPLPEGQHETHEPVQDPRCVLAVPPHEDPEFYPDPAHPEQAVVVYR